MSPISALKNRMKELYRQLGISSQVYDFCHEIEESLKERFEQLDKTAEYNQMKVLLAMQKNRVSEECFGSSSGYGYNDYGRDTLEKVYADTFHTEACLVRPQIACGTHALAIALFGNLRPGDEMLAPAGKPYDTLEEVIGIRPSKGSLAEYGVTYRQVDLLEDGSFDYENIRKAINEKTKLVEIQRSKGYMTRPSFSVKQIGELIAFVKNIKPDVICMVDNCYGEFVDTIEPSDVGADMIVGSLIKNPGGGLAPIGGYIAGTKECVDNASYRMTCPGLGAEVGATLGVNRSFYQGFFLAPMVTKGALKGAVFAANIYEKLGFDVVPNSTEPRQDIIQAVTLNSPERLIAFCKGIQAAAPVDSYVDPEPWDMPGYDSQVIMAAGAFVQGSSIELSADGPVKEPYAVYFQGGLTWEHAKLGVMMSLQKLCGAGSCEASVKIFEIHFAICIVDFYIFQILFGSRERYLWKKKRVVVIGGGASGLMASIAAAQNGAVVTVLEQNEKPGKKICATGNGKCNFTNLQMQKDAYRSENTGFEKDVLKQFFGERYSGFLFQTGTLSCK